MFGLVSAHGTWLSSPPGETPLALLGAAGAVGWQICQAHSGRTVPDPALHRSVARIVLHLQGSDNTEKVDEAEADRREDNERERDCGRNA